MKFFYWGLCLLLFTACGDSNKILEIDNPTEEAINLSFDDGAQAFMLEGGQNTQIVLTQGKHQVKINDGEAIEIDVPSRGDYLFNPTKSNYILEEIWYGPESAQAMMEMFEKQGRTNMLNHKLPKDTIEILGFPIEGHYKKIEGDLMIKQVWEIGVQEEPPATIQIESTNSFGEGIVKISRENEYIMQLLNSAMQMQADSTATEAPTE